MVRKTENRIDFGHVIKLFKDLNITIKNNLEEEFKIGHSYYMLGEITIEKLNLAWNYTIKPLLEEYFFDDKTKVNQCQELFDRTSKRLNNHE
jgi:5-methylcytosine-specific restriction enzyme B